MEDSRRGRGVCCGDDAVEPVLEVLPVLDTVEMDAMEARLLALDSE